MDMIVGKINLWKRRVVRKHFSNTLEILNECSEIAFPNLFQFKILPVSTCMDERAFST